MKSFNKTISALFIALTVFASVNANAASSLNTSYSGQNSQYTGNQITVKVLSGQTDLQIAAVPTSAIQGTPLFDPSTATVPFIDVQGTIAPSTTSVSGLITDTAEFTYGSLYLTYKDWATNAWINGDTLQFYIKESSDKTFKACQVPNQVAPLSAMIPAANTPITIYVSTNAMQGYNCQVVYGR